MAPPTRQARHGGDPMIVYALAVAWLAASVATCVPVGRGIRGPIQLATVTALFAPAAPSGEEASRRGSLPARLSPRAGLATSRNWKRFRRELASHGWLVGLLLAGVVGLVYGLTELQALTPTTAIR